MKENDATNQDGACWYVLHTRPRCEKKIAAYCATLPLPYYLPLRMERKKYQRRQVEVWKPLFPGYVFVRFRAEQKVTLLQSGQVARVLEVKDQERFAGEIEQIRKALGADPADVIGVGIDFTACTMLPATANGFLKVIRSLLPS